jgi:type VI secretion system secreted protein Hcp
MSNPAYLWLTDENGSPIIGNCQVLDRIGSIEIKSLSHHMTIPTDNSTGRLTGTRIHTPILIQKEFDIVTPMLYRAISLGITLKQQK